MKKLVSLLLLFSSLKAAAIPDIPQSNNHGNGIVYCVNGVMDTFNPQLASTGLTVETLSAQLYNQLLAVDPLTYRLKPELASRWQVLANGRIYRFTLQQKVSFQHTAWFTPSRTMNADDVVFSFARMLQPHHPWHRVGGGHYPYFDSLQIAANLERINKIDNDTVEFVLAKPDASFLWHIATSYAPILSAEYAQQLDKSDQRDKFDRYPVGTGAFQLAEYRTGQFIRLLRNPNYWQPLARSQQLVIDIGTGGTGRLSKLLTGECDILAYPSPSQLTVLRDDARLRMILRPGMNIAYLAFNSRIPPMNDVRVRHALALAVNNERLMKAIYYGTAETAASVLPRASWAYDNSSTITAYDPSAARAKLNALGHSDLTLRLMVATSSQPWNPSPLKMAELIQTDLGRAGVKVDIIPVEGRFIDRRMMDNDHELTLSGWATSSNDPDSFFRPILSCAAMVAKTNYAQWCNHSFDSLLERALRTLQLSGRIEAYHQAQALLTNELPILPLASSLQLVAFRHDIHGLIVSPVGSGSLSGVSRNQSEDSHQ